MQLILKVAGVAFLGIVILCILSWFGFKYLFPKAGEKDPNSMARALVGIVSFLSKSIVGLALIAMLLAAINANIITSAVGFPFITSIATYLIAFNVKDVFFRGKNKDS